MTRSLIFGLLFSLPACAATPAPAAEPTRAEVEQALLRAARFFRTEVAYQGTYLWQFSVDLTKREGEAKATKTQGWIQPPGTPAIGIAYLDAWRATANEYFLEAARETAHALVHCQLQSGGWAHSVELDPELRRKIAYREAGSNATGRNVTTFDDDTTQSALRFLMRADAALKFEDRRIRDAIQHALTSILKAQYPNGAWPQGYDTFPDPAQFPAIKANFPDEWSRTWPGQQYRNQYTLNDNNLTTLADTLFEAARFYENDRAFSGLAKDCRRAAAGLGDFLILAQMPDPQPAWAQQYNFQMQPAWARKFEPPAVTGGESFGAMRALMNIYRETADAKYLEPIPKALAYLRSSRLPDGRLARFYELRTNRPLYFTRDDYRLTYDDSNLPTHYAFKVADHTDRMEKEYNTLRALPKNALQKPEPASPRPSAAEIQKILSALDDRGRWIESGRLRYHGPDDDTTQVIRSSTFIRSIELLSNYLRPQKSQ